MTNLTRHSTAELMLIKQLVHFPTEKRRELAALTEALRFALIAHNTAEFLEIARHSQHFELYAQCAMEEV